MSVNVGVRLGVNESVSVLDGVSVGVGDSFVKVIVGDGAVIVGVISVSVIVGVGAVIVGVSSGVEVGEGAVIVSDIVGVGCINTGS